MNEASPYGIPNAAEDEVAHRVAASDEFNDDPVALYQGLLSEHGIEATGRIWSLACKLFDRDHATEGGGEV